MRNVIEEPLDISIENMGKPLSMKFQKLLNSHVAVPFGNEPEGTVVKLRFEDGCQEAPKNLLGNPVAYDRDAYRTRLF